MKNYTRKETDKRGTTWYYNDRYELHRTDGPAIEYSNGTKYWFINGQCHRLDGPAVEYCDGDKEWWINNKRHTEKDYKQHPDVLKYKQMQEAKQLLGVLK